MGWLGCISPWDYFHDAQTLRHTNAFEDLICRILFSLNFCVYWTVDEQPWWRHQMETFPALLALCAGNSPVNGGFPSQRPVTRSFDAFFDLRLNKRLSKQPWGWWFGTSLPSLCRRRNVLVNNLSIPANLLLIDKVCNKSNRINKVLPKRCLTRFFPVKFVHIDD